MSLFTNDLCAQPQWEVVSLQDTAVLLLSPHPTESNVLFASIGVESSPTIAALLKSEDYGLSWRLVVSEGDRHTPHRLSFDPFDSEHIIASAWNAYLESTDGGETWSQHTIPLGAPGSTLLSPAFCSAAPQLLFVVALNQFTDIPILRSEDGGATFDSLNVRPYGPTLYSFATHPEALFVPATGGSPLISIDTARTWSLYNDVYYSLYDVAPGLDSTYPYVATLVPLAGPHVLERQVARWSRADSSWHMAYELERVNEYVAVNPARTTQIAVSMGGGLVVLSEDYGMSWVVDSSAAEIAGVTADLEFGANGDYLFRAHGRPGVPNLGGLLRRDMRLGVVDPGRIIISTSLRIFPNPATTEITVSASRFIPSASSQCALYDLLGRTVVVGDLRQELSGMFVWYVDTRSLTTGTYFVSVGDVTKVTQRITILK